jgi:hypothetical protein
LFLNSGKISESAKYNNAPDISANITNLLAIKISVNGNSNNAHNIPQAAARNTCNSLL